MDVGQNKTTNGAEDQLPANESAQTNTGEAQNEGAANGKGPSETDLLKAELKAQQDKYLYLYAEFETYKKRAIKERSDLIKFGHENLAKELLAVTDNLDRALQYTENLDALVTGIKMVNQQLNDTLNKFGILPIKAMGHAFNPEIHEAVAQEPISSEHNGVKEGDVIREHQKGYTLHGRLLRPSRVVLATGTKK